MDIYLARTQGFCSGVSSAVKIVENALSKYGAPLYVYHEIVHNTHVVDGFKQRGVLFVESLSEIPAGARVIFSAHGIPPQVREQAGQQGLLIIDATCPLVKKVHDEAKRFSDQGQEVILIGHKGHQEIIGTSGYVTANRLHVIEKIADIENLSIPESAPVAYLTQTTLSIDETSLMIQALKDKFPRLTEPARGDICYATQRRQDAVKELAKIVELIIVCGSPNSSNSNRLRETGEQAGVRSIIIDSANDLDLSLIKDKTVIGISSGASVPRQIIDDLLEKIKKFDGAARIHIFKKPENSFVFPLPKV